MYLQSPTFWLSIRQIVKQDQSHFNVGDRNIIELDGQKLVYLHKHAHGSTILILHGWGSSSNAWVEVLDRIHRAGFDVIMPDLPGFGESPAPNNGWGVDEYAQFMLHFLEKIQAKPTVIVGHSFGGRVSIRMLLERPEIAKGLALCSNSGLKKELTPKQRVIHIISKIGGAVFSLPLLTKVRDRARFILYRSIGEFDYYRTEGTMRETFKRIIEDDITVGLEALAHPCLIIWGEEDRITPVEDAHTFHRLIENSRLEIVKRAGHRLPYERPKLFCQMLLDFVRSLEISS